MMISVPKGILRLATLKLLSDSSLSGVGLASRISTATNGAWRPGPGSVYLVLADLLRKGLIAELPKRGGNVRRYVVTSKGRSEFQKLSREALSDVTRQVGLLAVYASFAGDADLEAKVRSFSSSFTTYRPGKA